MQSLRIHPVLRHKINNERGNVVRGSSGAVGGFRDLILNVLHPRRVVAFLVFPSTFVFVHIGFYQIAHLHWIDLAALAVAHLITGGENQVTVFQTIQQKSQAQNQLP